MLRQIILLLTLFFMGGKRTLDCINLDKLDLKLKKARAQLREEQNKKFEEGTGKDIKDSESFNKEQEKAGELSGKLQDQSENQTITPENTEAPQKNEESDDGPKKPEKLTFKNAFAHADKGELKQVGAAGVGMGGMAGMQMLIGELIGTAPGEKDPQADSWKQEERRFDKNELIVSPNNSGASLDQLARGELGNQEGAQSSQAQEEALSYAGKTKEEIRAMHSYDRLPADVFFGGE